jgi:predicted DNA-binding transcriptional regulator AlpA
MPRARLGRIVRDNFMTPEVLTVEQFCELVGISKFKFYDMRKKGNLLPPIRRLGRTPLILRNDANDWLSNLPIDPEAPQSRHADI